MARPSKPLALVEGHRTKAEKAVREEAEKSLLTDTEMQEWPETKKKAAAHKEFVRLKAVFAAIKKDDSLHEGVINRYCLLTAECKEFEAMKASLMSDIRKLSKAYKNKEFDFITYLDRKEKIQGAVFACDKKIMERRKMLLDIEKENVMTIASALRSIPKKEEPKKESPMAEYLRRKRES